MASAPGGSSVYAGYIKEQLEAQQTRKDSLEQRGLSVITTSGALVTLLFGLAALSTKGNQTFDLSRPAEVLLVVALAFFFLSIVSALVTNVPLLYRGVTTSGLREAVNTRWDDTGPVAEKQVALTQLKALQSAKAMNKYKALALFGGVALEMVAVALVASAVGYVVWTGS